MVLALADLLSKELGWNVYVHNVGILVGCVFAISLSAYGLEKALWRTNFPSWRGLVSLSLRPM